LQTSPELVSRCEILTSVPGVGATIVLEMPDLVQLAPQASDSERGRGERHMRGGRVVSGERSTCRPSSLPGLMSI
jgi:hypothetical protein